MARPNTNAAHYETVTQAGPDAPWLTLVHALSQHGGVFDAQVAHFAPDFRLLLVDLPGHGRSAHLPGPYGLARYTASVAAALDAAGVAHTHYWGTHTGASVGLLLACRRPGLLRSLVLEGPVYPGRGLPSIVENVGRAAQAARSEGIGAARRAWWEQSAWFDVMRARPAACRAAEHRALVEQFDGRPWLEPEPPAALAAFLPGTVDEALAHLRLPVLIVSGEHELADFLRSADELAAVLPSCERAEIAEGGGFPLWEFPARVNARVRRFLEAGKA